MCSSALVHFWCSWLVAGANPKSAEPDHYRVLGVAPAAPYAEIRRAYTDRAFRLHPDRLGELSGDARVRAESKMAELNVSWTVLRDPVRRAAYDTRRRGPSGGAQGPSGASGSGVSGGFGSSGAGGRPAAKRPPRTESDLRQPWTWAEEEGSTGGGNSAAAGSMPRGRSSGRSGLFTGGGAASGGVGSDGAASGGASKWLVLGPLAVLAGLMVLIVVLAVLVGEDPDRAPVAPTQEFPVGSCVFIDERQIVYAVPCESANIGRVIGRVAFPRPCAEGTALVLPGEEQVLCLEPTR